MAGNIILPNLKSTTAADNFYGVWNLTRALKSAGYTYKRSGDGTTKETTENPLLDTWGPGAVYQSVQLGSQTGSSASVTTVSGTKATIAGLTGMTSSSIGHGLTISNATNSSNNGTFTIIAYTSATTVIVWNPNAVVENTSALTWSEKVSGTSASISASTGDEAILTGLSGLSTTATPGHYITITNASNGGNNGTFKIVSVISATSCKIKNSSAVSESGSLIWVENDPVSDIYPNFSSTTCWINMQGPSTMKLPINGASTGNFVRGENITQTSSGAQGELIGYLWDSPTNQGYLVVMPRLFGNGGGPNGWTTGTTDTITGSISGATVTTFSTPVEYVREFVWWKGTNLYQGWIAYQCLDQASENTSRFSYLASNAAGCTSTVAPGGGGTGNTFPSIGTMICIGATTATYTYWDMNAVLPTLYGRQHIITTNAIATTNTSPDGSFFFIQCRPDLNSNYCGGWTFSRLDNSEDGDVDPYVWYCGNGGVGIYTGSRTSCVATSTADMWSLLTANFNITQARGFRRRGFSTNDNFQQFSMGVLTAQNANNNNSYWLLNYNQSDVESVACSFTTTRVRESVYAVSGQLNSKMRKGSFRWLFGMGGGSAMDTFDNKSWIMVSTNTGGNAGTGPMVIGPWDGITVPLIS